MSRYIDAEWLKDQINTTFWAEIGKIIDNAPTIDIVQCKECVYQEIRLDGTFCERRHEAFRVKPDDYCSYGERNRR